MENPNTQDDILFEQLKLTFLAANTPASDDDEVYNGYVRLITGIEEGGSFHYKYYDVLEIDTSVETISAFG